MNWNTNTVNWNNNISLKILFIYIFILPFSLPHCTVATGRSNKLQWPKLYVDNEYETSTHATRRWFAIRLQVSTYRSAVRPAQHLWPIDSREELHQQTQVATILYGNNRQRNVIKISRKSNALIDINKAHVWILKFS